MEKRDSETVKKKKKTNKKTGKKCKIRGYKKGTPEILEQSGCIYICKLQLQSPNSSSKAVLLRKSRRRSIGSDLVEDWTAVSWWREE